MGATYKCPFCEAALNAKKNIILAARSAKDKNSKGLVLLHEELGNYTVAMTTTLKVKTDELVDFFCPVCQSELNVSKGENLASFIKVDQTGEETKIYISRIYGERCTFTVDDRKQVKSYGESVKPYLDPDWFKF